MEKNGQDGRATLRDIFTVARDARITGDELRLWLLYRAYDTGKGSWPGDPMLAGHLGKSVRSVQAYRARLLELGFLTKQFRGPLPAIYRATFPKASQPTATLDPESLATHCDALPLASQKASQKASQPTASLPPYPPISDEYGNTVRDIFDYWATERELVIGKNGGPPMKLTDKRRRCIRARLNEGYTTDQLREAIRGCLTSDYHVSHGYTDIELICRDQQRVEQFRAKLANAPAPDRPLPRLGAH